MTHSQQDHIKLEDSGSRRARGFAGLLSYGSSLPRGKRFALYAAIACTLLLLIWLPIGLFLALKPVSYSSSWALILPGSGSGHAVSLDSVGQATATAASPYNSHSVDPKVNYKAIAESQPVLAAAANTMGMTAEEFGKPRIKLVDQTALMKFRVTGSSAQQALAKSNALYSALQAELDRLRGDELKRREEGISAMLSGFSDKLRTAQQDMLDYQTGSRVVSLEQFNEITLGLERLRSQVRELTARRDGMEGRLQALNENLETSPENAISLIYLQQDPLFRELAREWAKAYAVLTKNEARWGKKHEQVVNAREDEAELRKALMERAGSLAPNIDSDIVHTVAIGSAEPEQYRQLIELHAERKGLEKEIVSLQESILAQETLLEQSITDASNLEDLKRRHQVATAVFTTALAKVDIGKSDRYSAYPLVQLLAEPTLPDKPDTLGRILALLGGLVASLFCFTGLVLLWIRKPFFRKILKN